MYERKATPSPLLSNNFLSELDKIKLFGVRVIKLITAIVLLLCFLILSYVIWIHSLQLKEIEIDNQKIENILEQITYRHVDIKHHIKRISDEINGIGAEIKNIEGKSTLKSFVSTSGSSSIIDYPLLNDEDINQIASWINREQKIELNLVYKASRDGDKAKIFHEKCDDIGPTVTVLKAKNLLFGGYTAKSWKGKEEFTQDEDAFLFSLDKKKMYPVNYTWNAIFRREYSFPHFGKQDLIIRDNCLNPSILHYSDFPNNYGISYDKLELTNGKQAFNIIELEVYQVIIK